MDSESAFRKVFRFGAFEFDPEDGLLRKRGVRLRIQPQPGKILQALLERPGELVSREELRNRLWPTDTFVEFEQGLNTAVTRLRQTLGDTADNPRFVQTEARLGYRMIAPVQIERGDSLPGRSFSRPPDATDSCEAPLETSSLARGHLAHHDSAALQAQPAGLGQIDDRSGSWRPRVLWGIAGTAALIALGSGAWRVQLETREKVESARQAYSRGVSLLRERTLPKVRQGADELRHAVQDNPKFAQAWASLAEAAILLDPAGPDSAIEYARRAVELDSDCGECHAILGHLLFSTKWKWDEAGTYLGKAAVLKPDDPQIQISLALREAALGRIAQGVKILDGTATRFPNSLNTRSTRAQLLYYARDYEAAIRESDRLTAINASGGLEWKSNALFQLGRNAEAIDALHGFLGSWSSASPEAIANRKNAAVTRFMTAGLPGALGDLLKLTEPAPAARVHSHNRARWLMLLGEHELAIKELQVALGTGLRDIIFLKVDPVFDPIRGEADFVRILKAIGLEH